jgi:hypothetical protein
MDITFPIPDDLAHRLGADVGRRALEAFGIDECRAGRLSAVELRRLLGLETEAEFDAFVRRHGISDIVPRRQPSAEEVEHSLARMREFRDAHTLNGLSAIDLIREGRR